MEPSSDEIVWCVRKITNFVPVISVFFCMATNINLKLELRVSTCESKSGASSYQAIADSKTSERTKATFLDLRKCAIFVESKTRFR